MLIRSIRLRNYKKYVDETVEFPEGLFGIIGSNGSGKTTLVEAVAWAIYGTTGSRGGKYATRWAGAAPDDDCGVELEFTAGSDSYRVVRELRGKGQSPHASLCVNGSRTVEGVTDVTSYLSSRIGMDHASFFASVFARQKELDALSDLRPGERKARIMRLLGIDSIDAAIACVRSDKKEGEIRADAMEAAGLDMDGLNADMARLEAQRTECVAAIASARASLRAAEAAEKAAKGTSDEQETKSRAYNRLALRLGRLEEKIKADAGSAGEKGRELKSLEKSEEEIKKIIPKLKPLPAARRRVAVLDKMRERHIKKSGLEERLAEADAEITRLRGDSEELARGLEGTEGAEEAHRSAGEEAARHAAGIVDLEKKIAKTEARKARLGKDKGALEEELGKIRRLGRGSKCPTCNRVLGDAAGAMVEALRNRISETVSEIRSEAALIEGLCSKKEGLEGARTAAENLARKLDATIRRRIGDESAKSKIDKQIREKVEERKGTRAGIKRLGRVAYDEEDHSKAISLRDKLVGLDRKRLSLASDARRIPAMKRSITALEAKIASARKKATGASSSIRMLGFDEGRHERSKAAHEESLSDLSDRKVALNDAENSLKAVGAEISGVGQSIREEGQRRESIRAEREKIGALGALEEAFLGFKQALISRAIPTLSDISSELLSDLTGGKYHGMGLDGSYGITIRDGQESHPLARFSGGETDLASLCLRIAISRLISERSGSEGVGFVVLDEIFGSQDDARRGSIIRVLKGMSSRFRQVMVITHVEGVKDMFPYALSVREGPGGSSSVEAEGTADLVMPE